MKETTQEESSRLGTGILIVAFFGTLLAGVFAWMENRNVQLGLQLLSLTVIIAALIVWSFHNPFYPFLTGTVIYVALVIALMLFFPENMFWGRRRNGPIAWSVIGLGLLLNACWTGYKELKKKNQSQ